MDVNSSRYKIYEWIYNTHLNESVYDPIFTSVTIFVSTFGIVGNCMVIWFLSFKIKRNFSTVYILNLALADAFFLFFVTIFNIISIFLSFKSPVEVKYANVYVVNVIYTLTITCLFGYNASVCILTAISVERCLSVLYPFWYHCKRPQHLSTIVCSTIWILSCLLSALEFSFCYKQEYIPQDLENKCDKQCRVLFAIICCLNFLVFIPLMIVSSLILLIKIWISSKQPQPSKLYLVITVTVLFFLLLAMPMRVLLLVWYKHHIIPPFPVLDIISLLCTMNSTINPFVYFLVGRQGIKSGKFNILVILQRVFRDDGSQYNRQQRTVIQSNETIM
ncbi:proto-oncogene Mas-like [Discoglossus pictus]